MKKGIGKFFTISIHILEYIVAALSLVVLVVLIGFEVFKMFSVEGYFVNPDTYIQSILTIVEFLECRRSARMTLNS